MLLTAWSVAMVRLPKATKPMPPGHSSMLPGSVLIEARENVLLVIFLRRCLHRLRPKYISSNVSPRANGRQWPQRVTVAALGSSERSPRPSAQARRSVIVRAMRALARSFTSEDGSRLLRVDEIRYQGSPPPSLQVSMFCVRLRLNY